MEILKGKTCLLFDGAMGTYYYSKANNSTECELANLYDSETVKGIHKEYIAAGADAIKTNTFAANPIQLGEQYEPVIKKAWEIANRAASGTGVFVFADIGPVKDADNTERQKAVKAMVDVFISLGARRFLLETFDEPDTVLYAAEYIRKNTENSFILSSFAIDQDGYTKAGFYFKDIITEMKASAYIDAFGFNCVCGPAHMLSIFKQIEAGDKPMSAMPNAGYSSNIGGRTFYNDNPEYFAQRIKELKNLGVKMLGGCCGTTPAHIKMASEALKRPDKETAAVMLKPQTRSKTQSENKIKEKILSKKKVIFAELDPPFNTEFEYLIEGSKQFKDAGVDAITITDSPLARARADSVLIAAKIKREAGIEAIPHITCRDRNLIGFKSAFLGMYTENIKNVLIITGDPVAHLERREIRGVFNLSSVNLMKYVQKLNEDVFLTDGLFVAGAINVNAANFDAELRKSEKKIENGAGYLLSQPIYSQRGIDNLKTAKQRLNVPVIVGIMPLAGYKNAVFLKNEIPETDIPDAIINQFVDKDREQSEIISVNIANGMVDQTFDLADGYFIMTPLKRVGLSLKVIEHIKVKNR